MSKLDDELARIDLASRATHLFRSLGCADEQAADAYAALAPKFTFDDGVLSFMGKPADADTMRAYLKESNRGYFLPADFDQQQIEQHCRREGAEDGRRSIGVGTSRQPHCKGSVGEGSRLDRR